MKINQLELKHFKNYDFEKFYFASGITFIVGANAQGKTNLLESLYILSIGKSPRINKEKQLININSNSSKISITFDTLAGKKNIEIIFDRFNKKIVKLNNINILKLTELVGNLSVVYFSPDELKLIKETPEDRRYFMDISISQFDKKYMYDLLKYNQILKMRNLILKSNETNENKIIQLNLFTPQLIDVANEIIIKRIKFIKKLNNYAQIIHKSMAESENLKIFYGQNYNGRDIKNFLKVKFDEYAEKELELKYTLIGPHRDDIDFKIDDLDCKYYASQGQQRTVALVVKLSLMEVIREEIGEYPVLLLDDVLSELDSDRQHRLLSLVSKYQTLISCTTVPELDYPHSIIKISQGKIINSPSQLSKTI